MSFGRVAPLADSLFLDGTAAETMDALAADPRGLLVQADLADSLSVETGDDVRLVLARGTEQQTVADFHVVGRFDEMPGFPEGVSLVAGLDAYTRATGLDQADFFLARTGRGGRHRPGGGRGGPAGRARPERPAGDRDDARRRSTRTSRA